MGVNQPYCLMPWIHFHVGDDGKAKACCVANIPYGDINTDSFEDIWNGESITQLRETFSRGEKDKRCAHCYKLEESGGTSIRQETFEKFNHLSIPPIKIENPVYFDIRFSNVCNFKCRTCWHGASSAWFEDAKILGTNKGTQAVIKNVKDFDQFIEKLGPSLLNAQEIYLAGGEPLATDAHYLLLNWLIKNQATKMKLRYNTNFSILNFRNYDLLELWSHFNEIEILASIDASSKTGAYIRSGFDWSKLLNNRKKINNSKHITFKIAPTISVMNVLSLPDLYNECLSIDLINPLGFYINILERPIQYNIQILPNELKQKVQVKYDAFITKGTHSFIEKQFQEILRYMWANDLSKHWPKFQAYNQKLDLIRDETTPIFF